VREQEEYADPRAVMAVISRIGPDFSQEEAFRLLYPKTAVQIVLPWARVHMRKEREP
jgi:hypothetical protein